jgi:Flp pilus assembly protein TadD
MFMRKVVSIVVVLCALVVALSPLRVAADMTPTTPIAKAPADPDVDAGRKAIDNKDWSVAIASFERALTREPQNADIENYLGYAFRNRGEYEKAFAHYRRALELNPKHRGAHEYIGEAYLLVGDLPKAQQHLAALDKLCFLPCEEYSDLKAKIAAYRKP